MASRDGERNSSDVERKNVSLTLEVWERLAELGTAKDSMNDVVKMLLDEHDANKKKR